MELPEGLYSLLNFDVDRYLNPWIPHNRVSILPNPISHWLGHRSAQRKPAPALLQWTITFLATVAGLCLVSGITNYAPGITKWHPPVFVASLGASAILDFNVCQSPLAQPRNSILGNTLSALVGVAISKLFQLNPAFQGIEWVSGAVGCAVASIAMSATKTIHPPGGATAVLASTQTQIIAMGWIFVPMVLLQSTLLVIVALIFNNFLRQYPIYWWTPEKVGRQLRREKDSEKDVERAKESSEENEGHAKATSDTSSDRTLRREFSCHGDNANVDKDVIKISAAKVQTPPHVLLSDEELALLERLQERIRRHEQRT